MRRYRNMYPAFETRRIFAWMVLATTRVIGRPKFSCILSVLRLSAAWYLSYVDERISVAFFSCWTYGVKNRNKRSLLARTVPNGKEKPVKYGSRPTRKSACGCLLQKNSMEKPCRFLGFPEYHILDLNISEAMAIVNRSRIRFGRGHFRCVIMIRISPSIFCAEGGSQYPVVLTLTTVWSAVPVRYSIPRAWDRFLVWSAAELVAIRSQISRENQRQMVFDTSLYYSCPWTLSTINFCTRDLWRCTYIRAVRGLFFLTTTAPQEQCITATSTANQCFLNRKPQNFTFQSRKAQKSLKTAMNHVCN